jgi:hypothetical protein
LDSALRRVKGSRDISSAKIDWEVMLHHLLEDIEELDELTRRAPPWEKAKVIGLEDIVTLDHRDDAIKNKLRPHFPEYLKEANGTKVGGEIRAVHLLVNQIQKDSLPLVRGLAFIPE